MGCFRVDRGGRSIRKASPTFAMMGRGLPIACRVFLAWSVGFSPSHSVGLQAHRHSVRPSFIGRGCRRKALLFSVSSRKHGARARFGFVKVYRSRRDLQGLLILPATSSRSVVSEGASVQSLLDQSADIIGLLVVAAGERCGRCRSIKACQALHRMLRVGSLSLS